MRKFLEDRFSGEVPVVGLYEGSLFIAVGFLGGFFIVGVGSLLSVFCPLFFFGTVVSGSMRESSFAFLFCPDFLGFWVLYGFSSFWAGLRGLFCSSKGISALVFF